MANPANPTSTRALEGAGGSSDSSDGKFGPAAKVGRKVVHAIVSLVFIAWLVGGIQIPGLDSAVVPVPSYVITGSSGTSDGGNLDGTYSLVDKPCGADARLLRADCDAGTCGDAPVYQRGAGAEGLVLYSTYVDCSGQGAADDCSRPSVWYVYGCSTPSRTAAATAPGNGYGYKYAMRYSTPGQPPGAPDDDAAYGAWREVETGRYEDVIGRGVWRPVDTPLAIHRTEDGDGCPNRLLAGVLIFVYSGVHIISVGIVEAWLTSQRNQLHREHREEAEARCIKSWTNSLGEFQSLHMTLVYCVPMPQPTAEAQYLKITKDVQVTNKSDWKQEGEMVPINHLLKYTGDARNMVIAAEMSRPQYGMAIGATIFGSVFAAVPLSAIAGAGCGVKLIWLLLIVIGVPIHYKVSAEKKMEKERANPDGTLEEVDEQGKEMAMTTGSQTVQQVTGEVLNPTATAVLQATAVPIAEATGDPEIASQDSVAAGYAPPPPPGASTARAAFARACVAAIDTGCCHPQVHKTATTTKV
jgi:hypothetical protein